MCGGRGVGKGEGGGVSTTGCLCLHLDTGDTSADLAGVIAHTLLVTLQPPLHYHSALSKLLPTPISMS